MRKRALIAAAGALVAAALLAGCGLRPGGGATATPAALFGAGYPTYRDAKTGIRTILGTPDLAPGTQRVGFVMSDAQGQIRVPQVTVDSYFYPDGAKGPRQGPIASEPAHFYPFPTDPRGIYVLHLNFDRAGTWGLDVHVPRPDGTTAVTTITFPVPEHAKAPEVGAPAPDSHNKTAADVSSLAQLTTGTNPNPALYQASIAGALAAHRPFVVVFTSPAFCTTELCGPEVDVVGELAAQYAGQADFIHVDLYANPDQIQGDLARAVRNPVVKQWNLPTDEWTFVVGTDGRIAARFESFVTKPELEAALRAVLPG